MLSTADFPVQASIDARRDDFSTSDFGYRPNGVFCRVSLFEQSVNDYIIDDDTHAHIISSTSANLGFGAGMGIVVVANEALLRSADFENIPIGVFCGSFPSIVWWTIKNC